MKSVFEGVENLELSALVAAGAVEPKLKDGFGNAWAVVAFTSATGAVVEGVGAPPKVKVDVSDTTGLATSVLVTPAVEAGVSTGWALEVGGAPKLKVRVDDDAAEDLAGSVGGRLGGVDLTTAGVGTVAVEDTVTVDSDGSLNVTKVSGFFGGAAELLLTVDATTEEEEGGTEEEREKAKPPTDDGVGTGPSTFSPIVKGNPPGFLAGCSCSFFFLEASSASFSF